jgi:hypothetical protein
MCENVTLFSLFNAPIYVQIYVCACAFVHMFFCWSNKKLFSGLNAKQNQLPQNNVHQHTSFHGNMSSNETLWVEFALSLGQLSERERFWQFGLHQPFFFVGISLSDVCFSLQRVNIHVGTYCLYIVIVVYVRSTRSNVPMCCLFFFNVSPSTYPQTCHLYRLV